MLTDDEALAVVLGLLPGSPAIEGALAKLDRVLPDALRRRIQAAQDALAIGLEPGLEARERFDTRAMLALAAAVHDGKQVRILYRAFDGKTTQRTIDPYGVVFQSGRWYLAGWDHLRHAPRTFRMDRLLNVDVTDRSFIRSAYFDAVTEVQHAIATAPWALTIDVVLDLPIEVARRRVSPTLGTLEQRPDGVLLRFGADSPDWAVRYLIGLNARFTILEPPELQEAIRRLAGELLADHELVPLLGARPKSLPGASAPMRPICGVAFCARSVTHCECAPSRARRLLAAGAPGHRITRGGFRPCS